MMKKEETGGFREERRPSSGNSPGEDTCQLLECGNHRGKFGPLGVKR